ncbi:MAG TPA: hypothetical protein VKZ18_16655 [Polyangia bacterium]|nr:hypothetical protein [Polyangia bacterium]
MAGKVTGPGGGPPGSGPVGAGDDSRPATGAAGERPAFADKLKSAGAPASPSSTDKTHAPAAARSATADLAAELKAGKITPQAAVDRVIDRVVDTQLGSNAPAAVREKLRAALETAVADDPLLADKIRGLA